MLSWFTKWPPHKNVHKLDKKVLLRIKSSLTGCVTLNSQTFARTFPVSYHLSTPVLADEQHLYEEVGDSWGTVGTAGGQGEVNKAGDTST